MKPPKAIHSPLSVKSTEKNTGAHSNGPSPRHDIIRNVDNQWASYDGVTGRRGDGIGRHYLVWDQGWRSLTGLAEGHLRQRRLKQPLQVIASTLKNISNKNTDVDLQIALQINNEETKASIWSINHYSNHMYQHG
jgi:hypothetical protein